MSSYGCQQNLISPDRELRSVLEFVCEESNKLANCGTYYSRQLYFKTGKIPGKYDLHKLFKENLHFKALYSHVAQQTLTSVAESFKSYIGLLKGISIGTVTQHPKLPKYRKNSLKLVTFPRADVKLKNGQLRFPLGSKVKLWFGISEFYLPMPSNLDYKKIREIRILPRNGQFYVEFVYQLQLTVMELDASKVLGIDPGLNNWLTCVSNVGTSFIVDGRHLKSLNQWYNKRIASIKEHKPQGFWSKRLAKITEKRNRQTRDAVNKAARLVLNHCLENKIGTIVFGWNKGMRQEINLGSKTNQKFVQIPTARLKDRISGLCEQYGIRFVETEESYTSKASFLDEDELPKFGEKTEGWKESGKRINRGLYCSKDGSKINADCNGAGNILRKVAATLGLCLKRVSRGALISPLKVRIWTLQESPSMKGLGSIKNPMKLSKIDLSSVLAVGHSNGQLGLSIDRGQEIEFIEIAAPEAAMHGLQMVDFIANTDSTELNGAIESPEIAPCGEPIAMMSVDSQMARAIGYNQQEQVLQIEFSSGSIYQYSDVEPEIWESLQDTDSTGRFFNSEIKGYYSSQRVDDESAKCRRQFQPPK